MPKNLGTHILPSICRSCYRFGTVSVTVPVLATYFKVFVPSQLSELEMRAD